MVGYIDRVTGAFKQTDQRMLAVMVALDRPDLLADSGLLDNRDERTRRDNERESRRSWTARWLQFIATSG